LDPNFRRGFEGKGMIYWLWVITKSYRLFYKIFIALSDDPLKGISSTGSCLCSSRLYDKTMVIIEKIKKQREEKDPYCPYIWIMFVYAGERLDKAF
jgi:hypothetical protein